MFCLCSIVLSVLCGMAPADTSITPDPEPPAGILRDLPDQKAGGKHAAVAGAYHAVTGADEFGFFHEIDQRCGGVVARDQGGLARWLYHGWNGA